MKTSIKNRTFIILVTVASLLIALQPAITYACETSSGHCGG